MSWRAASAVFSHAAVNAVLLLPLLILMIVLAGPHGRPGRVRVSVEGRIQIRAQRGWRPLLA